MTAARANGVFCLEGTWERRLDDRTSVLPSLELLERIGHIRYIHRDVGTSDELYHYLAKWAQRGYHAYSVLYFAFHGVRGGIEVGRGVVPLSDLAEKLEGSASGRVIHFGACSVMSDRDTVASFTGRPERRRWLATARRSTGWSRRRSTCSCSPR